jgi:hypothetical protein
MNATPTTATVSRAEATGSPRRPSVAVYLVTLGIVIEFLSIFTSIFTRFGLTGWTENVRRGEGDVIIGTIVLALFLALLYPAARGRKWALALTLVVQALLLLGYLPIFLVDFPKPGSFRDWSLITTPFLNGLLAVGFGVLALVEAFGKARPTGFRTRDSGLSRQVAIAGGVACAWAGMVVLGLAVAQNPPAGATFAQAPDDVQKLSIEVNRFGSAALDLKAGRATALFLTNTDRIGHTFDVDALNVHVDVPAGATAVAMLKPESAGSLPFYCSVPGHKEAGMVGTLNLQ